MTLCYLNWCQLSFQATIKSLSQRAVIWQKTNTPATLGALRRNHMRPPVRQVWQGLIAWVAFAAPPVHYILAYPTVLLSYNEYSLLFQGLTARRFAEMKSELIS